MKIRRCSPEPRLEMTPLMDIIFLLLTFFVYALVLMVRAEILGVSLPTLGAAEAARQQNTVTIAILDSGTIAINGDPVTIDELIPTVKQRLAEQPDAKLLVAADTQGRTGDFMAVIDALSKAGLRDFALIGRDKPVTPDTPISPDKPSPPPIEPDP